MKVKDVNGNERDVSVQTGRGYYDVRNEDNIMGFRYNEDIYILSADLTISYTKDTIYDTATKVEYDRINLVNSGNSVTQRSTNNRWGTDNTDINTILSIVAAKLDCEVKDIEIVMVDVNGSKKLSTSHAAWKRQGRMPSIKYCTGFYHLKIQHTINYTGAWPMPKHLLDRCTITETNNSLIKNDNIKIKQTNVEMI